MQLIYSTRKVVHWIWGTVGWGGGGGRRKDYKGTRGNWKKMVMFIFFIVAVVSQMPTLVKTYKIVHSTCGLLYLLISQQLC